jgi:peptidoglycan DL-endopeptidase CwlO
VSSMPQSRHVARRGGWRVWAVLVGAIGIFAGVLPAALASPGGTPSLSQTLAEANKLSEQIDALGQQYDNLQIQLQQARAEAKIASESAARDARLVSAGQAYVDQIAVEGYMTGGLSPTLQLFQSSNAQSLLDRASILTQLEQEDGSRLNVVVAAETTAERARGAALQEEQRAAELKSEMAAKQAEIQTRENFFNSQAFQDAAAIFAKTGHYPDIKVRGDSIGVQALRWALTRLGDEYVWGGAGPTVFDCSGLVVWSYAQIGITLEHFTGDLWNEGEHISRSELEPGDLVFFYADLGHVGIYMGNGLMVDAPTFGQPVQVQPVMWAFYAGAVRIVG